MKDSTATPSMNLFFNMMTAQFYEFLWKWWRFVLMKHCAYTLLNRHSVRQWQPYVTWHCFNKCGLVHFIRIWHNNESNTIMSFLLFKRSQIPVGLGWSIMCVLSDLEVLPCWFYSSQVGHYFGIFYFWPINYTLSFL